MTFDSFRHLHLNFHQTIWCHIMLFVCAFSGEDGLALSSTHRRENKNWQQGSLREAEGRRSEVEFYYWNWIPSQYWNFESHHLPSPSLVLSFALCLLPLFTSMCLKGELTELARRPGQTEKHLVRREEAGEGQMKSEGKLEGYKWEGEERKRKSHSSLYSSSFLFNCLCSSLPLCPFLLLFLLKSVISEDAYSKGLIYLLVPPQLNPIVINLVMSHLHEQLDTSPCYAAASRLHAVNVIHKHVLLYYYYSPQS